MVPPQGFEPPNQQIMRRFEGHQQGQKKQDEAVLPNPQSSRFVNILLRQTSGSRHLILIRNLTNNGWLSGFLDPGASWLTRARDCFAFGGCADDAIAFTITRANN